MTLGTSTPFIDYAEQEDGSYLVMEVQTGIRAYGETPLDGLETLVEALDAEYGDELDDEF